MIEEKNIRSKLFKTIMILCFFGVSLFLLSYSVSAETVVPIGGVGSTIDETFPDDNLAQAVADNLSGGDVNAILTQNMVDNLFNLEISFRNINDLTGIGNLTALRLLDVWGNQITSLPTELFNLTSLQYLGLGNNKITILPSTIGDLVNLKTLDIGDNLISALPDEIYNLTTLDTFILSGNYITSISSKIEQMSLLKTLNMSGNQIGALPNEIAKLFLLEEIYVDSNLLTEIPSDIGNLTNLRVLGLDSNQLTQLPESIGNLSALEMLSLSDNQLTSLPSSIGNLSSLNLMYLFDNLLPTNYADTLNTLGFNFTVMNEFQHHVMLKSGLSPFNIKSEADLNNIDLFNLIEIRDVPIVSPSHQLLLENYVDSNNNPVNLNDYIENGVVKKSASIFAQIRAAGSGLFPNSSDNAVTVNKIQLNFEINRYNLSFDLNGGLGTPPATQSLSVGTLGTVVADPMRADYTFKGWNTSSDGKGDQWNFESSVMPAQDVVLYAQWENNEVSVTPVQPTLPKTGGSKTLLTGAIFILLGIGSISLVLNGKRNRV